MVHSRCRTFRLISPIQLFNRSIKEAAVAVETVWATMARGLRAQCLPPSWCPSDQQWQGRLEKPSSTLP